MQSLLMVKSVVEVTDDAEKPTPALGTHWRVAAVSATTQVVLHSVGDDAPFEVNDQILVTIEPFKEQ